VAVTSLSQSQLEDKHPVFKTGGLEEDSWLSRALCSGPGTCHVLEDTKTPPGRWRWALLACKHRVVDGEPQS
jgi:hypothetical protein